MKSLSISRELLVYEKFPKLCDHVIANYNGWTDSKLMAYLRENGFNVSYKQVGGLGAGWRSYVVFEDDKQYLDFVLRYS